MEKNYIERILVFYQVEGSVPSSSCVGRYRGKLLHTGNDPKGSKVTRHPPEGKQNTDKQEMGKKEETQISKIDRHV